ncbi:MAG TPA: hypothetical protein VIW67_23930 [Terriglobales bacterium]
MTRFILFLALLSSPIAFAQMPIPADRLAAVSQLFEKLDKHSTLHCSVLHFDPFLDFTFRYEAGLLVSVRPEEFTPGANFGAFLRITPQDGKPAFFGEQYDVPPIPAMMAKKLTARQLKRIELQMSVGFAIGDGRYAIDLLLADAQDRTCHARWNLKTPKHNSPLTLPTNTVASIEGTAWDGKLQNDGVRLTVLLHVAPLNPYSPKLHAWDRGFLLQSLASLLKQLPCQSVRVIAFNLDQQQELFREENFDDDGYARLVHHLHKLEFGTVSYRALQRDSWQQWLVRLANQQTSAKNPSDVVVFLGPNGHFLDKVPSETRDDPDVAPRFFYFEYYPWMGAEFSDSIDYLTRGMHGTVYKIHSADQLGQAIQKMQEKMKQAPDNAGISPSASKTSSKE